MRAVRLLVTIVALTTIPGAASAQISVGVTHWLDAGLNYYDYEILNKEGSGQSAYFFMLDGIDDASIWDFPTDWAPLGSGPTYDGWASWYAGDTPGSWVAPGESLWGFTIRSPWGPGVGRSSWTIYYDDESDGGSYDNIGILGPKNPGEYVVPEPASMALMALTLGIAGGAVRRRRARGRERDGQSSDDL